MPRKSSFGRPSKSNARPASTRRLGVRPLALEPLEERRVLAAYINEIYFNPPGTDDTTTPWEYIELRGTPNMSLDNHFLIIVENEDNITQTGFAGVLDEAVDLTGYSFGSNGFLVMRKPGNPYTVAPGTNEMPLPANWDVEGSGFTAMIIDNVSGPAPVGNVTDIDELDNTTHVANGINDGMDYPTGQPGWQILDAIGIHAEAGESANGHVYAQVNFGVGPTTHLEPGASYTDLTL